MQSARQHTTGERVRILHRHGVRFSAVFTPATDGALAFGTTVPALLAGGPRPATVRLSTTWARPDGRPSVLGLAVKVPGLGPDGDGVQDLLLASSTRNGRWFRRVRRCFGAHFSAVVPHHIEGERLLVGATVEGSPPVVGGPPLRELALTVERGPVRIVIDARHGARWPTLAPTRLPIGVVELCAALDDTFPPGRHSPSFDEGGFEARGAVMALRRVVYAAAQGVTRRPEPPGP